MPPLSFLYSLMSAGRAVKAALKMAPKPILGLLRLISSASLSALISSLCSNSIQYLYKASDYANKIKTSQLQLPFINLNIAKLNYYKAEYTKAISILEEIEINQQQIKKNRLVIWLANVQTKNKNLFILQTFEIYTGNKKNLL